jgi:predicted nucleotidyltransferase
MNNVIAVGLYGSWIQGGACNDSDYDICVIDDIKRDFLVREFYILQNIKFDFLRIPYNWINEIFRPELDHIINECLVLQDPKNILTDSKKIVNRLYRTKGRVEIRTNIKLGKINALISRSFSSLGRNEFETPCLFVDECLIELGYTLMDLIGVQTSGGSYLWDLRKSCELAEFNEISSFVEAWRLQSNVDMVDKLKQFKKVWQKLVKFMKSNCEIVTNLHEEIKNDIEYRCSNGLSDYVVDRAIAFLKNSAHFDAQIWLRGWLNHFLIDYGWIIASINGVRFDYPVLLDEIREFDPSLYVEIREIMNIENMDKRKSEGLVEITRRLTDQVKEKRMMLLNRYSK